MDIQLLSTMLRELILENDRVGLPGIGTFVAEEAGASFSDKGYTINPPYRKLTFSSSREEDSLLAEMYASSNGIDRESAVSILDRYLAEIRQSLEEEKSLTLPGLGRLRVTRANEVFFIPDADIDISPAAFGLESVSLRSHTVIEDIPSVIQLDSRKSLETEPKDDRPVVAIPETPETPEVPSGQYEAPVSKQVPEPEPEYEWEDDDGESAWSGSVVLRTVIICISVLLILLAAYVIIAKVAPDFIDSLLYTAEERAILDYRL